MFGELGKIMKLLGKLKTELPAMQEQIANRQHTAEAGNGAVTVTVNGKMALTDLRIDRDLLPDAELDTVLIEDLVKAAVSAAQLKAVEATRQAMLELTDGEALPPGLDGML